MRSNYKVTDPEQTYFITSTIVEWIPVFLNIDIVNILIEAVKYNQENKGLKVYAYVIMPEHFHMIAQHKELVRIIQSIKSYSAKKIIEYYEKNNKSELNTFSVHKKVHKIKSDYQIWQEGFHPQMILTDDMLYQKFEYIHYNPLRRGFVSDLSDYQLSSYNFYDKGIEGIIKIDDLN